MDKNFATILKELRISANFSQKDVYDKLGIKQSTFSAWETGRAEPSADMLLKLCQLYNVNDVLTAFGYRNISQNDSLLLNQNEIDMVNNYRLLDKHGKELMDLVFEKELERCGLTIVEKYKSEPFAIDISDFFDGEDSIHAPVAAHNDQIEDEGEMEKIIRDLEKLKKPE